MPLLSISGDWGFYFCLWLIFRFLSDLCCMCLCLCILLECCFLVQVFLDTSSQPVSAPGTSFSYLLSVGSLWNAVASGSLLVGTTAPVGDCWQSWVFGMQPTRGSPFSTGCQLRSRGCLFDGCGSQECSRAPPPRPTTHYPQPVQVHTTFFQRMQCSAECNLSKPVPELENRWQLGGSGGQVEEGSCSRWSRGAVARPALSCPTQSWADCPGVRIRWRERFGGESDFQ